MDLIPEGLRQKLIRFEDDKKYVVYVDQAKRRRYDAPEEQVQVETYLKLILRYKYPPVRIRCYVPVQIVSDKREADINVYADDKRASPLIVAECKAADISELEFLRARDQASSYAVAEGALMARGDQPPVGILLCSEKDETKVEFATGGLSQKLFVSRDLVALPSAEQLKRFVAADRTRLERP